MNHFALHLKLTQHCKSIMCGHAYSVVSNSLRPHGLKPTRLLCPWNFPGKNTGVGCHSLLLTQESNLSLSRLLHWHAGSLPLAPPERRGWSLDCLLLSGCCCSFLPRVSRTMWIACVRFAQTTSSPSGIYQRVGLPCHSGPFVPLKSHHLLHSEVK